MHAIWRRNFNQCYKIDYDCFLPAYYAFVAGLCLRKSTKQPTPKTNSRHYFSVLFADFPAIYFILLFEKYVPQNTESLLSCALVVLGVRHVLLGVGVR